MAGKHIITAAVLAAGIFTGSSLSGFPAQEEILAADLTETAYIHNTGHQCGPLREVTCTEIVSDDDTDDTGTITVSAGIFLSGSDGTGNNYGPTDSTVAAVSRLIELSLRNFSNTANISSLDLKVDSSSDYDKITEAFSYVTQQNPEFFYVSNSYNLSYNSRTGNITTVHFNFIDTADKIREYADSMNSRIESITASLISDEMTDYQKAVVLHDYLVINAEYDYDVARGSLIDDLTGGFSAYDILVCRNGVCQGYALAYMALLDKAGVDSVVAVSSEMGHAWNLVKIDDSWYHADVTWDDPLPDYPGMSYHSNFLVSDIKFDKSGGGTHYSWKTADTTLKASSLKYDADFLKNVKTECIYENGKLYYFDAGGSYCSYEESSGKITEIFSTGNPYWYVWDKPGYIWTDKYISIASGGGKVYFNTPTSVYEMKADGTQKKEIASVNKDDEGGYIYSLVCTDNVLYAVIRTSPSDSCRYIRITDVPDAVSVHEHEVRDGGLCSICGEPVDGRAGFDGVSVSLRDGITMNYFVKISESELADADSLSVRFTSDTIEKTVGFREAVYDEEEGEYVFGISVRPDCMTEEIVSEIFYDSDNAGPGAVYSLKEYLDELSNTSDAHELLRQLAEDLLRYGAFSQIYTGHRTDFPAYSVESYSQSDYADISENYAPSVTGVSESAEVVSASLLVGGNTSIRIRYRLASGVSAENLAVSCSDSKGNKISVKSDCENGYLYVTLVDVRPQDLDEMYEFTVDDGKTTLAVKYSGYSYIRRVLSGEASRNQALADIANSLYEYSQTSEQICSLLDLI